MVIRFMDFVDPEIEFVVYRLKKTYLVIAERFRNDEAKIKALCNFCASI